MSSLANSIIELLNSYPSILKCIDWVFPHHQHSKQTLTITIGGDHSFKIKWLG